MANQKPKENPEVEVQEETKSKVLIANSTFEWAKEKGAPKHVFLRDKQVDEKKLGKETIEKMIDLGLVRKDYL